MAFDRNARLGGTRGLLPPLPQPAATPVARFSERASAAAHASVAEYRKTTVTLTLADMEYLDTLALDVRRKHRTHINRGEIIRALITALRDSGLDLTIAPTETAIRVAVAAKLRE